MFDCRHPMTDESPRVSGYQRGPASAQRKVSSIIRLVTLGSSTGSYGGPFTSAGNQVSGAYRRNHDAVLLCGYVVGDAPVENPLVVAAPVRKILPGPYFSTLFSLTMLRLIWRRVGTARVLHVSLGREMVPIAGAAVALARRKALIVQPHGMLTVGQDRFLDRVIDAIAIAPIMRRADHVVALTPHERERLVRRYYCRRQEVPIAVIGNGVRIEPYDRLVGKISTEVLFLGRLHPRKRVVDFIAAAKMSTLGNFVIVGPDGGDLSAVEKAVEAGEVRYETPVQPADVSRRVKQCAIFVLCARDEPWGNVLVTALSLGLPYIITSTSDLAVVIRDHGAGIVVTDSQPDEIARAVDAILADSDLYRTLSANARRLAEDELSVDATDGKLAAVYSDVLRQRDGRRRQRLHRLGFTPRAAPQHAARDVKRTPVGMR